MKYTVTSADCTQLKAKCLVVGVYGDGSLPPGTERVDQAAGGAVKRVVKNRDIDGKTGSALLITETGSLTAERILVIGLGDKKKRSIDSLASSVKAGVGLLKSTAINDVVFLCADFETENTDFSQIARLVILAIEASLYRFDEMKSKVSNGQTKLARVRLAVEGAQLSNAKRGLTQGQAIARGTHLAKDLGNLPGNVCTPSYLARQARKLGRELGFKVSVLDEKRMAELKMGALLSVSRGSREPAKLIVMEYRGAKPKAKPIVIVGKGLTFDAGGISLKPAGAMDEMKYDMCGAAAVFGTLRAAAEMKLPLNVIGVVPSSENLPDGAANKPGDIVTSMAGKTIEILNTDAEGRLILCDAITYARRYEPKTVIDVATLTGACVVALGAPASGLFSNDDDLAEKLLAAGDTIRDRAWRLPLWDEYQKLIDSPFADIANVGGRSAGAVTAACFLARFTDKLKWAHLDIAGTAWRSGAQKSATGRPVGLLSQYLIDCAAK